MYLRLALPLVFGTLSWAQSPPSAAPNPAPPPADSGIRNPEAAPAAPAPGTPTQDKRIFGVLPNYRTVEGSQVFSPITVRQKFYIASKDSFDGPGFALAGVFALLYQAEDQNPSFGQGLKGYAHRYVTAYGDQVIGNMMTEAIVPSLLHEDPRYFRRGTGSAASRVGYALSRIVVTHTDSGGSRFNTSEILGNGIAASISNAYYPDERGFGDTMSRMVTAIGTDAISDILKEFWPDVKKRLHHRQDITQAAAQ
jgi:hypothetical protein